VRPRTVECGRECYAKRSVRRVHGLERSLADGHTEQAQRSDGQRVLM